MISTGDAVRCLFMQRVGSEHDCRSLQTSAQPSLPICGIAAERRRVGALERAGIRGYAHHGAHIFRHSLATELLRSGATLSEIGHLLGHASKDTTRIYAKVDFTRLRTLSLPWPGGVQ
jgi:integrase